MSSHSISHSPVPTTKCDVPAFWDEYKDRVFAYIRKRVKDQDTARDIHQEVLLKVYEFCLKKSGVRNPAAWLYQIASNTISDYFRQQNKLSSYTSELPPDTPPLTPLSSHLSPQQEAARCITPLLKGLPETYRLAVQWADLEGIPQKEIASRLGLSLSGAKSRVQRGREKLRELMIRCCKVELSHQGEVIDFVPKADCDLFEGGCS